MTTTTMTKQRFRHSRHATVRERETPPVGNNATIIIIIINVHQFTDERNIVAALRRQLTIAVGPDTPTTLRDH